jgi:hypothetical protein
MLTHCHDADSELPVQFGAEIWATAEAEKKSKDAIRKDIS